MSVPRDQIKAATADVARVEAPVTAKAYFMCVFAAFGGIFFGYDTGWISGVMAMEYFITLYTGMPYSDCRHRRLSASGVGEVADYFDSIGGHLLWCHHCG